MKTKQVQTTTSNRRFASEEAADSLLADILESTEEEARREQAELEQTIAERRASEADELAQKRAALLAERSRKLEAELERQRRLAENRTRKMDALRVEETPAPPAEAPSEPTALDDELARPLEPRRDDAPTAVAPAPQVAPASTITARHATLAALAAVSLLAVAAAVVGFTSSNAYDPDRNLYAKAVFAPSDRDVVAMEVPSLLIPAPAPAPSAAPAASPVRERRPAVKKAPKREPRTVVRSRFEGIDAVDPFSLD